MGRKKAFWEESPFWEDTPEAAVDDQPTPETTAVIEYLKKNLEVRVSLDNDNDWYTNGMRLDVEIRLGDEVIASDYSTLITGHR